MSDHYLDQASKSCRAVLSVMLSMVKKDHPNLTPIEEGFVIAMLGLKMIDPRLHFRSISTPPVATEFDIHCHIQHPVGRYRVDFALEVVGLANGKTRTQFIAIECDGFDFHHRSREQVTNDKAREREIVAAGYKVIRFSGTEIYRDCVLAASQAWHIALDTYEGWLAE